MIRLDRQFSLEKAWTWFLPRMGLVLFLTFITFIEHTSPYHPLKSNLVLLFLFQFCLYFPFLISLSMVISVGLLYDLLAFSTLGGYTLLFLVMKLFLEGHKDYLFFKDFHYVWGIFILFLSVRLLVYRIFGWHSPPEDMIWTCILYPLTAKLIQKTLKVTDSA